MDCAGYRKTMAVMATMRFMEKSLANTRRRMSLGSWRGLQRRSTAATRSCRVPPLTVRPPERTAEEAERIVRQGLSDYAPGRGNDRRRAPSPS